MGEAPPARSDGAGLLQAAALLFSEFHRLGVLESQLFVDDKTYEDGRKSTPIPT